MKVLHLLTTGRESGAEKVAIRIIESTSSKYQSYYASPSGPIENKLNEKKIIHICIKKMNYKYVKDIINQYSPDIIHAHDFKASLLAVISKKNSKVISHIHHNLPWTYRINYKTILYRTFAKKFDAIIGVSKYIFEGKINSETISQKKYIINNPMNFNEIRADSLLNTSKYKINKFDLLYVGRLSEEKNPLLFLTVSEKISEILPEVKIGIIGTGVLENEMKERIDNSLYKDNFTLFGHLDSPYSIMSKSKIVLITSNAEGFGLVALESLFLGIPVLCTPVGGLQEIVYDGINGYLCNSESEFVTQSVKLLENSNELLKLSKNAKEFALKYEFEDNSIARIMEVYEQVID